MPAFLSLLLVFGAALSGAELPAAYRAAREAQPDASRMVNCENIELRRPAAQLKLESGRLALLPDIAGRGWAAVFQGQGRFHFAAASKIEREQTRRFSKKEEVDEVFTEAMLLFSDETVAEILQSGKLQPGAVDPLKDTLKWARESFRDKLRVNIEAAVVRYHARGEGAYFLALLKTKQSGTLAYEFAPLDDEEISLLRLKAEDTEIWNSFPLSDLGAAAAVKPLARETVDVTDIAIEATVDGAAHLEAQAVVEFKALRPGELLVPVALNSRLRVSEVKDESGGALEFIQESEKHDGSLWVFAAAPLETGKTYKWSFTYAGKGVIEKAGDGNFLVGARSTWFPRLRVPGELFADRARFHMRFKVPKNFTIVATGRELSRKQEGKFELSEWDSVTPATVAGFNYGKFTVKTAEANGFKVSVHANSGLTNELAELKVLLEANPKAANELGIIPSALNTTSMSGTALVEALNCLTFYTRIFGPQEEKYLRVTSQPAGYFGQSWPGLLFLPYTSFLDTTARNQLKMDRGSMRQFLAEVGPHEIAHQWWGHALAWRDYHDQWISEGFAEYSAGLFQQVQKGEKAFLTFLRNEQEAARQRASARVAPNDAGPIWLGWRLSAEDSPGGGQLIYSKGAYVLHMLRMMQHDYSTHNDSRFLDMMRSFVRENLGRAVSTSDFERHVSKHFGQDMTYFFDQWVRGTAIPRVRGQYSTQPAAEGTAFQYSIKVDGVPEGFRLDIPLVVRLKGGTVRAGQLRVVAPEISGQATLPADVESIDFAPMLDVLGDIDIRRK